MTRPTALDGCEHRCDARKFAVEIARVGGVGNGGLKGRRYALVIDVVPIDRTEEGLRHDLLGVGRTTAKTLVGLAREQLLQDGDRIAGHGDGIERLVGEDGLVDFIFVFTAKG